MAEDGKRASLGRFVRPLLLVVVAVYGAGALRPCYLPLDTDEPVVWLGQTGPILSRHGGRNQTEFALTDRKGEQVPRPRFAWRQNEIAYWSHDDKALCIVPVRGPRRWIDVGEYVRSDARVYEVRAAPEGACINLESGGDQTGGDWRDAYSLRIEFRTGTVTRVPDALAAKTTEFSPVFAVRKPNRTVEVRGDGRQETVVPAGSVGRHWDFDPVTRSVCYDGGLNIVFVGPRSRWTRRLGAFISADDVAFQPGGREIWVAEFSGYPGFRGACALDDRGRVLTWKIKAPMGVRAPMRRADAGVLALLEWLPKRVE